MRKGKIVEPKTAADDPIVSIDASEIIRAIRFHPWLIVVSSIGLGVLAWMGSSRLPKVYEATATVVIEPVLPKVLGDSFEVDELSRPASSAEQVFYNTQYSIMRSRAVIREAIARLNLTKDEGFLRQHGIPAPNGVASIKHVEAVLADKIQVSPQRESRIAKLIVEDYDRERVARIANVLVQVYVDQSLERRLSTTRGAARWLDKRVTEFAQTLDNSHAALNEYKRKHMLVSVSVEDRKNMTSERLRALNSKLLEAGTKLIELESERNVLTAVSKDGNGDLNALPRVRNNSVVSQLRSSLIDLERKMAELSSRYGARHPNMASIQQQIDRLQKLQAEELNLIAQSLDNEITTYENTVRRIKAELKGETEHAMQLNNLALDYARLNRDVGSNESMYQSLLKRQTETDLSGLLESNFVRLLETAEPPTRPIRPSITFNTMAGWLLGLLLGMGLAIGVVLLDNTVHTQSDIEDRLRLAFLGLLPAIGEKGAESTNMKDLFIVENPTSSVAECARSVRTNLLFLSSDQPMKRLLLTSAGPSEGKSTTVVTLGTTMALAESRVLVVDTDLRRPRLHKTFGVSSEEGLTSVLLGSTSLDKAIKPTSVEGLDFLPCGPLPPNPSELLHMEAFQKLLGDLDARYDRILFDSPPVNAVTDPAILAQIADGTILVVKSSKTTKDSAKRAARQLDDVNANLLGVVLNEVDFEEGGYYHQNYYYYYKRGYGRSESDKAAKAA